MDLFSQLRQRAADKRDEAIKAAKAEFHTACRLLDELAVLVPAKAPTPRRRQGTRKPIIDLIADAMPRDRAFTIREVLALIQQAAPERDLHEATVRAIFARLVDQGMVRKVRKGDNGTVLWAATGSQIKEAPIAALPIMDAIGAVLAETGPLQKPALVVALQERGYRADADQRALLRTVTHALKRSQGRFKFSDDDGRWGAGQ